MANLNEPLAPYKFTDAAGLDCTVTLYITDDGVVEMEFGSDMISWVALNESRMKGIIAFLTECLERGFGGLPYET